MKLPRPLVRLPLRFDAEALARDVAQFDDDDWMLHPTGFEGSSSIALVSARGELNDDFANSAPMRPTPHLERCPTIRAALASLRAPISRTRLMRLHAGHSVPEHLDDNYHWWRRRRIHIPITTDPRVAFHCGGQQVHMAAGESWTFDNQRLHRVDNPSPVDRVHLVADTLGSPHLERLLAADDDPAPPEVPPPDCGDSPWSWIEPYRFRVLEPAEVERLSEDIWQGSTELRAPTSARAALRAHLDRLRAAWRAAFARHGHDRGAELAYAAIIREFVDELPPAFRRGLAPQSAASIAISVIATVLQTTNRVAPLRSVSQARRTPPPAPSPRVGPGLRYGLSATGHEQLAHADAGCPSSDHAPAETIELLRSLDPPRTLTDARELPPLDTLERAGLVAQHWEHLPTFDRPVFIVAAPRSGSSLLFERMASHPRLWSLGRESDDLFDRCIGEPDDSDARDATGASPTLERQLRAEFVRRLIDHRGLALAGRAASLVPRSLRLLEKTPRNALRIPLLRALWPDARFIYLHRAPAPSIASIMEAWRSGGFVTRHHLPGWSPRRWSLLLPPGWESLDGAPLAAVAAFQWRSANAAILDALASLGADAWTTVDYRSLLEDPAAVFARLYAFAQLPVPASSAEPWPGPQPLSRHTVSAPSEQKWQWERDAIEPLLPDLRAIEDRILSLGERSPR